MKPLLEPTSPQYLRRLVRALNAESFNGFYVPTASESIRCNRARFTAGRVEVREIGESDWIALDGAAVDPCGREIVASRQA
jgi:hypothetical protein